MAMTLDRLYNGVQLISPPPEETLRRQQQRSTPEPFKRKRTGPLQPQEATPNPKPRKQSRQQSSPASPRRITHANNPHADFIPPPPPRSARTRRTTPIPHYDPPAETFTPPREVILTPSISKSSKRKTNAKQTTAKSKKLLQVIIPPPSVKKEPPLIDLSAPMPPPSPTDDPLLLSGPILPQTSSPIRPRERKEVGVVTSSPPYIPSSLPPSSCVPSFDWTRHTEPEGSTDLSMILMNADDAEVPHLPLFNLNIDDLPASSDAGGWSDSDDDDATLRGGTYPHGEQLEGEGEYTGKWKMMTVRTKLDPPSSATRERMEEWGRPITPFPKRIAKLRLLEEEEEEEQEIDMFNHPEEATDVDEEREVREMSIPLDDEEREVREMSIPLDDEEREAREMSIPLDDEEREVRETSIPLDDQEQDAGHFDSKHLGPRPFDFDLSFEDMPIPQEHQDTLLDASVHQHADNSATLADSEDDEEEREVRQMSVEFEDGEDENEPASNGLEPGSPPLSLAAAAVDQSMGVRGPFAAAEEVAAEAAGGDSSDEVESDFEDAGLVKITSTDPKAAARAAAILKQHDYECFTKIVLMERRRQSYSGVDKLTKMARRKTVSGAGIVKGKSNKERRRSASVIEDRVYIPGSPATTLPELLREAEAEMVTGTPVKVGIRDPFTTPLPYPAAPVPFILGGEQRLWTRGDWKQLDACFTDERFEVGHRLEVDEELAPIDHVRVEDVVQRFILLMGGEEVVHSFGDEWSRDNIIQRVRALKHKQRCGNVAPPTTPYTPSPGHIRLMQVPDFTPLGRQSRPAFPLPVVENAPFASVLQQHEGSKRKLPASLLAPRYSHLLEEAVSVSQMGTKVLEAPVEDTTQDPDVSVGEEDATPEPVSLPSARRPPTAPPTIGKRVKGFLSSYLPTLSKTALPGPRTTKQQSRKAGLPLPPPEVLEKPRGPVSTPVRPPLPKAIPPKELVQLNPAPQLLTKASMIPRVKKPQRLVELQPLPPQSPLKAIAVPRPRRSSGGSVKDLVRSFEDLEKHKVSGVRNGELKRMKSNADWKTTAGTGNRPGWKP